MPNIEALEKLADGLENYVKDEWFNMRHWTTPGFHKKKCGSTACGLGWAVPLIQDPRLQFDAFGDITLDGRNDDDHADFKGYEWSYDSNVFIAKDYFDIPIKDAADIFYSDDYPSGWNATPQQVAAKIRDYIKKYQQEQT